VVCFQESEVAMIALNEILVATDFGAASDAALAYARDLARQFGATLYLLHVAEDVYVRLGGDAYATALPAMQKDVEEAARQRLETLARDAAHEVRTMGTVMTSGTPASSIVQYAREHAVDLIVVGTHNRGAVAHLLMGSVAERVVRTAPCPVLTVRHPEQELAAAEPTAAAERE
jgi:nucleotide-binding universal stress UspA family protein